MRPLRATVSLVLACALMLAMPVAWAGAGMVPPAGESAERYELKDVLGSIARDSWVVGNRLVTVGATGLAVWDTTTPDSPVILGQCVYPDLVHVVATATYAFAVTTGGKLVAFDISTPSAPAFVSALPGAVSSPSSKDAMSITGTIVYLAGTGNIVPIDVSDPAAMIAGTSFLGGHPGGGWSIDVEGDRLAAANDANIAYFDIADPSSPATISITSESSLDPGGIDLVGTELFVGSYNDVTWGFVAFDLSGGSATVDDSYRNGTWFGQVAVSAAGVAHVVSDGVVVLTIDVTDPTALGVIGEGSIGLAGNPSPTDLRLDSSGTAAYWCDLRFGLFTFDVSDSSAISVASGFHTPQYVTDVATSGNVAYVADSASMRLLTYDITDPAAPVCTSDIALDNPYGLRVHNGLLLVNRSPGSGQFTVFDLADPLHPVETDSISIPASSYAHDVAAVGDRAYVVVDAGVRVIDISDSANLAGVGSWTGSFNYTTIDAVGTVAVVGATSGSLQALDITNDTPVTLGSSVGAWDMVNDVLISGSHCYVATQGTGGGYGVLQLGFSSGGLGGIEYYGFPGDTETVRALALTSEGRLVASGQQGVYTWNLPMTQNFQPPVADYGPIPNGQAVALSGSLALVGAQYNGLYVLDGPDFTGPAIDVTGVDDGGVYDGSVTPVVTIGEDAVDWSIELDGQAWTPGTITEPGVHNIALWAVDNWGNETNKPLHEFTILTGEAARLAGEDRYATSADISASTFDTADTVVIATGRNYPDALAAAPLAYEVGAPVLLVNAGTLPEAIAREIDRLGATRAYVVGGTSAIPDTILGQLNTAGIASGNIKRIAGATRYETARLIAEELRALVGHSLPKAYIATGEKFPDALAAGGLAAREGAPVLLVRASGVPDATDAALDACGVTSTVVLGGTAAIPATVAAALPSPTRISGADRYETCRLIAEASLSAGFSNQAVYLSTGANFPDALSAGAASAANGFPVLLVKDPLPAAATTYATDHAHTLWNVLPVGGTTVVPESVFTAFKQLLL